jgi:hypothetical protein
VSDNVRVPIDDDKAAVFLMPRLPFRAVAAIKHEVIAARNSSGDSLTSSEVMGILSEGYLLYGIAGWTLDVPFSREAVRDEIMANDERAFTISEQADSLYAEQVLLPLARLGSRSSRNGSTNGSTSVMNGSSPKPRKRSKRSSTSTTPTVAIVTTTQ